MADDGQNELISDVRTLRGELRLWREAMAIPRPFQRPFP